MEDQTTQGTLTARPTSLLQGIVGSKDQIKRTLPTAKPLTPHPTHLRHPHPPQQANVRPPHKTQVKTRKVPRATLDDNPKMQAGQRLIFLCLISDRSLVEGRTVEEYIVAEWQILKCNIVVGVCGGGGRGLVFLGLSLLQLHLSAG